MPSKSKSQQKFFALVRKCQKTGKCDSPEIKKTAKSIKYKDAEEFASTKHEGLPGKVEKKKKKKKGKKKMFKSFKEWADTRDKELQEMSTTTGDMASFRDRIGGGPRLDKKYPDKIALGDEDEDEEGDDEDLGDEDEEDSIGDEDLASLAGDDEDDEHPDGCRCSDCKCKKHGPMGRHGMGRGPLD